MKIVKSEIKKEIESVLKRRNIRLSRVILFGSRVRGNYTPESDWDLMIVLKDKLEPIDRKKLWIEIYKKLHRRFPMNSFDIFIKSEEEFEEEKHFVNTISNESKEGIVL